MIIYPAWRVVTMILASIHLSDANEVKNSTKYVKVFYYIHPDWGKGHRGEQSCSSANVICDWDYSGNLTELTSSFRDHVSTYNDDRADNITVSMYNIHSLWHKQRMRYPPNCSMQTNLSLACSDESIKHPSHSELFPRSFPNFDGYSTTSPMSSIQKYYEDAYLNEAILNFQTKYNMKSFTDLIKASSYVASSCHGRDGGPSKRDQIVLSLRSHGFRVDGLGGCLKSKSPEGIKLVLTNNDDENVHMKRKAISQYLFNMAFENAYDQGYVTEKAWDALYAGTVPVYWGDERHLKELIPHPKAVIFVADFDHDIEKLSKYLTYLSTNESAYEEHREWRKTFNHTTHVSENIHLKDTWYCRTCMWAVKTMADRKIETTEKEIERKSLIMEQDNCDRPTS